MRHPVLSLHPTYAEPHNVVGRWLGGSRLSGTHWASGAPMGGALPHSAAQCRYEHTLGAQPRDGGVVEGRVGGFMPGFCFGDAEWTVYAYEGRRGDWARRDPSHEQQAQVYLPAEAGAALAASGAKERADSASWQWHSPAPQRVFLPSEAECHDCVGSWAAPYAAWPDL